MTEAFIALMALAAMAAVLWPILKRHELVDNTLVEDTELGEVLAKKDAALLAIDELEADFRMGNLSEVDYSQLRTKYDEQAMAALRSVDEARGERVLSDEDHFDALIKAQVARRRQARKPVLAVQAVASGCPSCGQRLVPGAAFCAYCGTPAANTCHACAAEVGPDARFCAHCGTALGAVPAE